MFRSTSYMTLKQRRSFLISMKISFRSGVLVHSVTTTSFYNFWFNILYYRRYFRWSFRWSRLEVYVFVRRESRWTIFLASSWTFVLNLNYVINRLKNLHSRLKTKNKYWEYLLKVNRHSLTKDKFAQEIDQQFKLFELIYNEMQGKMYLSNRWTMDPRHNKDVMYSISKQRDLYAMQQSMNSPAKTATTAPAAKMHPQPKV